MKKFKSYLIFVLIGLVITAANLSIYLSISHRSPGGVVVSSDDDNGAPSANKNIVDGTPKRKSKKEHEHHKKKDDGNKKDDAAPQQTQAAPVDNEALADDPEHVGAHHHRHKKNLDDAKKGAKVAEGEKEETKRPHHRHHQNQEEKQEAESTHHIRGTPAPPSQAPTKAKGHHHTEKVEVAKSDKNKHHAKETDAKASNAAGDNEPPASTKSKGFKKYRGSYVAYDTNRSEFSNLTYDEATSAYHTYLKVTLKDELEQSSRLFKDIIEHSDSGVLLPTSVDDLSTRFGISNMDDDDDAGYCDPQDADYTAASDEKCKKYLADIRNWLSIKPMSSILSSGRTIKFKVFYKHNDISAVMKVSQKKFALEPASEVMAFFVDRVLGFNRVPPVVWTPFPVPFLQAACATMDPFYAQWYDKFSLHYSTVQPLISNCFKGMKCVNISLQLWMFDVHNAEETVLRPSQSFSKFLSLPSPDATALAKIQLGGSPMDRARLAYAELMDEFIFDIIIGNTDRWFGHNSFVLGGCEKCTSPTNPKRVTKSTLRYAFIDQGSSFYRSGIPDMNPFSSNYEHLCRFRKSTAENLIKADEAPTPLHEVVKAQLPKGLFHLASKELIQASSKRLKFITNQIRACLGNYSSSDVLFF